MPQQGGTIIAESIYKSSVQNIFDKMSNYEMYQRFLYHTNSINTQNQGGIYCVAVQVSCGREICFGRPITRGGSSDFSRQELPVDDIKLSRWKCWKFWQTGESQMRRWGAGDLCGRSSLISKGSTVNPQKGYFAMSQI